MFGLIGKLLKLVFVGAVAGAVAGWFKTRAIEETYNYPTPRPVDNPSVPTPNVRAIPAEPDIPAAPLPPENELVGGTEPVAEIDPNAPTDFESDEVPELASEDSTAVDTDTDVDASEAPGVEAERSPTYARLTPESTEGELEDDEKPVKWVQPVDGKCPETHQIKARFSTGRYHRPGDRGYDRIAPDCCYASEQDAESDGFSRARW